MERQRLVARLREAGAEEVDGRYRLGAVAESARRTGLATAAQYILRLAQCGVAAGARRVTIEGSRYGTVFMHDGAAPSADALADLILGRPLPRDGRAERSVRALADGIAACLAHGAAVELNVKGDGAIVRVEMGPDGVTVDPGLAGSLASHWDVRVRVKGLPIAFGEEVRLVRDRCRLAPAMVVVDERPINLAQFGGAPLKVTDLMRGRCITCAIGLPFMLGAYGRDRHVVEVRWLPVAPDIGGIGLPQPSRANLVYERVWDEPSWPRLEDPGCTHSDTERNRCRRSFVIPMGDEEQRRVGVYRGVAVLHPRLDAPSRQVLVMDGVTVEEAALDAGSAVETVLAVDELPTDDGGLLPLHGGAYLSTLEEMRGQVAVLDRVLSFDFVGVDRSARLAHAITGHPGARVLRW